MTFKKLLGPSGTVIIMLFRKTGRETNSPPAETFMELFNVFAKIVDFGSHFGADLILKEVPKTKKISSEKRVGNNMIFDFF